MSTPISRADGIQTRARAEQEQYNLTPADGVEITCECYAAIMRLLEAVHELDSQHVYTNCQKYWNRVAGMQNLITLAGDIRRGKSVTVADIDGAMDGAFDDQEQAL